jgi:hypothetical protein
MKKTLLALLVTALAGIGIFLGAEPWLGAPAPVPSQTPRVEPQPTAPASAPQPATAASEHAQDPVSRREAVPIANPGSGFAQGVRGQVVADGAPVAGVAVFLQESLQNDLVKRLESMTRDVVQPPAATATTDGAGVFLLGLSQPPAKNLELWLFATGYAEQRIAELTVRPGAWVDLGAIALDVGRTLRGRVTIAGTPLPASNAVVSLENANPLLDLGSRNLAAGGRRSVQVDGIGRYELAHLPAHGMWRLIALAPGFARQIREEINLAAVTDAPVDFELLPGLSIAGRLDGSDGRPVAGARIVGWPRTAEPAYLATSGADGRFQLHGLREGPHRLRVDADGYQTLDRMDVAAGTQNLVLSLQRRGGALVTVRSPDGSVLREYRLAVRRYLAEAGGNIGAVPDLPERTVRLGPDEVQATVSGIEPGPADAPASYVFQVEAKGFAKTLSPPFTIDPIAPTRVEMTMTRGGVLTGRVFDERGEPIADARVSTQAAGAVEDNPLWRALASLSPDRITRTTATTGADGSWRLEGLAHAGYQLEIVHGQYCRTLLRDLQIIADVEQTVPTVTLRRGTLVRGRTLVDGSPHGQVCVVLTPAVAPGDTLPKNADESTPVRVEAVSDNDGFFTLPRRIPPGLYDLRARLQQSGDDDLFAQMQQMQRSATTLSVSAGRDTIEQDVRITK